MDIQKQVAVITGGASGLGYATAVALSERGATVAILDRNEAALDAAIRKLKCFAVPCDVRKAESVVAALDEVSSRLGAPRICVQCAGVGPARRILGRDGPMALEEFTQVVDVNLIGTFNVMRLVAARMSALEPLPTGERGVIINTASIAAYEGQVGQAAYAASKGAVVALTLPAARELALFGIRVLAIAPGIFLTPMLEALPQAAQEALGQAIPFPRRLGSPAEFAALTVHMAENVMLNGEVVRLDGAIRLSSR